MTRTLQLEVRADRVSFELDRFDSGGDERLELTGRWFGVRGRRFMRPTLTLFTDEGAFRALADLEHKPWAPEEGGSWEAAFPWAGGAEVLEVELAVSPDVTIALPAPGGSPKRRKAERGVPTDPPRGSKPAAKAAPRTARRDELEGLREQLAGSRREVERLRQQVNALREEAEAGSASKREAASALEAAKQEADAAHEARDVALAEVERANLARDKAIAELQRANAARDAAVAGRDDALVAQERALAARDEALTAQEQERQWREHAMRDGEAALQASGDAAARSDHLQLALEAALTERNQLQQALDHALRERDDAISARGAALVMRNATQAGIGPDHHAGWLQRTAAVIVLICGVFALLIVLHLL